MKEKEVVNLLEERLKDLKDAKDYIKEKDIKIDYMLVTIEDKIRHINREMSLMNVKLELLSLIDKKLDLIINNFKTEDN